MYVKHLCSQNSDKSHIFHPTIYSCGPFGERFREKFKDLIANAKNSIVTTKVAPQLLLLKMHAGVAQAAIEMMIKIVDNRVHLFEPKVNTISHTLSSVTSQEQPILRVITKQH
jgi:flagellar biosynthesis/type III secretory pathway protein FliH